MCKRKQREMKDDEEGNSNLILKRKRLEVENFKCRKYQMYEDKTTEDNIKT